LPKQVKFVRGILGCEVATLPFRYLGFRLGIRKDTVAQLQPAEENAVKRLQPWCAKLMNHVGKKILVQTTLSAMLVHAFEVSVCPTKDPGGIHQDFSGLLVEG
jgi:hypothetical protein